ncbi:MAG: MerR family transcriptional regulator [Candidatus Omnitrophota bacterium]|nr:MerR family transcriptional regulator [Candidatus Omnitrophota bacterium]
MEIKSNEKNGMTSAKEIMNKYLISYQMLNHYTDLGLLPVLLRMGNVRYYNRVVVDKRIKKMRDFMKEGYSLQLVRKKLVGI